MKRIVSVLSILGLLGAILCSIFLFQSDWIFSFLFKLLFIFISLFIVSVSIRASNVSTIISIVSLICFGGTIFIFVATDLYLMLWNFVLAGHILLIGYTLYKEIRTVPSSILQNITSVSIIVLIATLTIAILLKSQNELIFTCLFFLLAFTSILLVVSKITSALNRK